MLADFDPSAGMAEDEWARGLAAQGWQIWAPGAGPWVELNGRRVRRWTVRRQGGHPGRNLVELPDARILRG